MYKIWVVEDDTTINQVICEFLKESNYSVTPVYDGAEALRQFEEETFDLVILDMMLPSVSGLDVLKEILSYACGLGYRVRDLTFSPITGGEGNIEFLAYLTNDQDLANDSWQQVDIAGVVEAAHTTFE